MNLKIGEKIRELRKARGITQESLASTLGISFQSVSKWENGIALPDITLLPALSNYFNVSVDALLGIDRSKTEDDIRDICEKAFKYRNTYPAKARAILEDGLTHYPDNAVLLNNLLYVIDFKSDPDEMILYASRLIDIAAEDDIKYDGLRFLSYAYHAKGDLEATATTLEQIPEFYFSALSEKALLLKGEEKRIAAEKQKWLSFEMLLQMMRELCLSYREDGKTVLAIAEAECALKLLSAMDDHRFDGYAKDFTNYN